MSYAFRQTIIDALINDDGSFTTGTLFDRAWFQSILSDFNAGFRIAKNDNEPAVDIDAVKSGIVAGLGGNNAPDTGFFRYTDGWRARNAADSVYRQVEAANPTTQQAVVTKQYYEDNTIIFPGNTPVGGMMEYIAAGDPGVGDDGSEWIIADGRTLARAAYPVLDALLFAGTYPFGDGDGSTTFNVPDRRGWLGIGTGGVPNIALGATAGAWDHTHTYSDLPQHTHAITDPGHSHLVTDPGHAHAVTDPGHTHAITDPGHGHGITDTGHTHVLTDPGHGHAITDAGHVHVMADPGHGHALDEGLGHDHGLDGLGSHTHVVNDTGHSHAITDPKHSHVLTDGGHSHSGSSPSHTHAVTDPGHGHPITDPAHDHQSGSYITANHKHGAGTLAVDPHSHDIIGRNAQAQAGGAAHATNGSGNTNSTTADGASISGETANAQASIQGTSGTRTTGISINSNATGISLGSTAVTVTVGSSTTGVSIATSSTGITINNGTTGITLDPADLGSATIDLSVTGATIASATTGVTANTATTGISVVSDATGITIASAGTGITVNSDTTGISMATVATGLTVNSGATGVTVDSGVTSITVDQAGIASPETDPANPPVLGLTYIIRVA